SDPWAGFDEGSPEARLCAAAAERLARTETPRREAPAMPRDLGRSHSGSASTQQAFGRFFMDLAHEAPEAAAAVVSVSPDVASSTNLGGWINRVGVWNVGPRIDWFADESDTLVSWREAEHGQPIQPGIAQGKPGRGDARARGRRAPVDHHALGGDRAAALHGLGAGLGPGPRVDPAARPRTARAPGRDLGLPAPQHPPHRAGARRRASPPSAPAGRGPPRRQVLAGGYRLREAERPPAVTLVGMGAIMPELLEAAAELEAAGMAVDAVCLTSPDLIFRALQARQGLYDGEEAILAELFPPARSAPIVSVLDGHPHTLSFLAAIEGAPIACLGVQDFGQSGDVQDLYRHFGIDAETILGAALDLIG